MAVLRLGLLGVAALCFACATAGPGSSPDALLLGDSGGGGGGDDGAAPDDATTGDDAVGPGGDDATPPGSGDDSGPAAGDDSGGCDVSVCPTAPCMNMTTPCCKTMGGCGCGGTLLTIPYCI